MNENACTEIDVVARQGVQDFLAASREAQGLPPSIEDEATIARLRGLLTATATSRSTRRAA